MGKTTMQIKLPAFRNEYEKLVFRMNSPRVVIDNSVCDTATVVKVDSARKHGILLEAVQILTDLNLSIKKGYIAADGRWFMDVFHVTDLNGNKLTDESVISYIKQSLGTIDCERSTSFTGFTALELTGIDRIGLLSEIFAVLSDLQCNVVESKVWTHNNRIAALIFVKEIDAQQVQRIDARLKHVLNTDYTDSGGDTDITRAKTFVSMDVTMNTERRLHQMMYADRDYEMKAGDDSPLVTVLNLVQSGYSVINVQCRERSKLLFDVVCTLTDMEYYVFHATFNTTDDQAYLEFYIRHTDGTPISSEAEAQRVIQCLRASIERRGSQGVRLELSTEDRNGLLADVTRTFREHGLNVTRADISTTSDTVQNVFYVTDSNGNVPDSKIIESVREKIGLSNLNVKELPMTPCEKPDADSGDVLLSIGKSLRRNLYNMGLIRSYI